MAVEVVAQPGGDIGASPRSALRSLMRCLMAGALTTSRAL
jgi:hypothetical protein